MKQATQQRRETAGSEGLANVLRSPYGVAFAMSVGALALAALFGSQTPHRSLSLLFFFTAVAGSAAYGGLGPGLFATICCALTYDYFFLTPLHSIFIARSDLPLFVLFLLVALLMNILSGKLKAETLELSALRDDLNQIMANVQGSLDLAKVADTLKTELSQRLRVPGGLLLLMDENNPGLNPRAAWGLSEPLLARLAETMTFAFFAPHILQREEFVAASGLVSALPELASETEGARLNWRAFLFLPLVANGEFLGVLCLFDFAPRRFQKGRLAFYETLGRQISVILQNARLYGEVEAGREHLERLSRQLVNVQEAERQEIARELHDEIGQMLTGLKFSLEMNRRLPESAQEKHLCEQIEAVTDLMNRVSDLSLNLRPAMLDDLGLLPTLLWHFERYTASTGVTVCFEHNEMDCRFSYEVETTAYRVIQEALTNAARHAGVASVRVRLWAAATSLVLQITDQGCGFDAEEARRNGNTGGLAGMEERVKLLGGQWSIETGKNSGTRITAELPVNAAEGASRNL